MLSLVRHFADAAVADGIDLEAVCRGAGLDTDALLSGMDSEQLDKFLTGICLATRDPAIGLKAALLSRPERFGPVQFLAMSSATLGAAFKRLARYSRVNWGNLVEFSQWGHRATLRLTAMAPDKVYARPCLDLELGAISTFARTLAATPVYPTHATLVGTPPAHVGKYKDVLGCWPKFNQSDTTLVFRAQDMDTPLISANGELELMFESFAEETLQNSGGTRTAVRARLATIRLLRQGLPTIESVASEMFMSPRTLQRKLACEGLKFIDLLNDVRIEIAKQQLSSGVSSSIEISAAIGFDDPNSFFRAFKRWTGQTPEQFRRTKRKDSGVLVRQLSQGRTGGAEHLAGL